MSNELQNLDVTKLVEYTRKINDIANLNKMLAGNYLRDFIIALDITASMLSKATKANLEAKASLDRTEAIAFLDKAGDYLQTKGISASAEARKKYIDIDPDVIEAKNKYAASEAMCVFLKAKLQTFRCAHDDVKKISYGDTQQTNYEGF